MISNHVLSLWSKDYNKLKLPQTWSLLLHLKNGATPYFTGSRSGATFMVSVLLSAQNVATCLHSRYEKETGRKCTALPWRNCTVSPFATKSAHFLTLRLYWFETAFNWGCLMCIPPGTSLWPANGFLVWTVPWKVSCILRSARFFLFLSLKKNAFLSLKCFLRCEEWHLVFRGAIPSKPFYEISLRKSKMRSMSFCKIHYSCVLRARSQRAGKTLLKNVARPPCTIHKG